MKEVTYTGFYRGHGDSIWTRYPELRWKSESELLTWAEANTDALNGVWVNHLLLLDSVPADRVVVCSEDGILKRLVDHPRWEKWKGEMTTGEFYSCVGTEW